MRRIMASSWHGHDQRQFGWGAGLRSGVFQMHARMSKSATIRARIELDLKSEVEKILSQPGLTASETFLLLYRQIKLRQGLPFEVAMQNALTARMLGDAKAGKNVKRFRSKIELYAALGL